MDNSGSTDIGDLHKIFWARSVAIVGASTNPAKLGHIILRNLIEGGYQGRIYPINPSAKEVLDLPAFPELSVIPGEVDLVVFCVPGPMIPDLLDQAKARQAVGAIVISGGFREVGNVDLEHELASRAKNYGIHLIGPNCQGINFTPNRMCASWPLFSQRGSLAIISQSGTIAAALAGWAEEEGLGISGVVSLGNQIDLCETDFLRLFGQDLETRVIAMYIEGVKNGARFIEQAKKVNKPVLILKSGYTTAGEKAAASHTKSLAGSDKVFSGVCQQVGAIRTQSIEELYDFSKTFARLPQPQGNRLMIVTSSGGSGILAVDIATENGLSIPSLPSEFIQDLRSIGLPSAMVVGNPLDLTGDAAAKDYSLVLKAAEKYDLADLYLIIFGDPIPDAAERMEETLRHLTKPVGICYLGGGKIQEDEIEQFHRRRIPVFATPERAAKALAALFTKAYQFNVPIVA